MNGVQTCALPIFRIAIIRRTKGKGDLIEAFKLLKCIANLDYSLFSKLSEDSKVRGHTYKIVKNSFRLDVRKKFFSNRVVDA